MCDHSNETSLSVLSHMAFFYHVVKKEKKYDLLLLITSNFSHLKLTSHI